MGLLVGTIIAAIVVGSAHAQTCSSQVPRRDCGFPGITRGQCVGRSCCYDDTVENVPWCFRNPDLPPAPGNEGVASPHQSRGLPPYRTTSAAVQFSGSCLFHCTSVSRSSRIQCGEVGIGEERCLRIGCCFSAGEASPERRCYHPAGQDRPCPSDRCQIPSGNMVLCASGYIDSTICQILGCCSALFENNNRFCYRQEDPPTSIGSGSTRPLNPTTTTTTTTAATSIATTTRVTTPTTTQPPPPLVRICRLGRCLIIPGSTSAPTQCFPTDCGRPRFFPGPTIAPPTDSRKKIVGGTRARRWSHPWTAMILKREGNRQFLCGAAVICDRWLVTAAHCMNRQSQRTDVPDLDAIFYTVHVGRHVGWEGEPGKQVQIFEGRDGIEYLEQHENFTNGVRRGVLLFDIGLIRLKRRIEFNQYVQPACLPDARPKINETLLASGWGITRSRGPDNSELKQLAIKVRNETVCEDEVPLFNASTHAGLLCAGGRRFRDTCTGDSGGPLVGPKTMGFNRQQRPLIQRWMLYGLTSLGSPSCNTLLFDRQPALYTDIAYYMDWIKARTQHCCR